MTTDTKLSDEARNSATAMREALIAFMKEAVIS
jgi:hypothetical protein